MSHNRRKARLISNLAIVSIGALVLAGCSSGSSPSSSGSSPSSWKLPDKDPTATINVLSILQLKSDGMQPVIDAFEKAHPTITVKYASVSFDSLNTTLDARISNKSGNPDVYWADQPRIAAMAARGEAEDLTSQLSKFKSAFDPSTYASGVYNKKLWALPIANSTQLLYYNKDLLKAAGLTEPSVNPAQRMSWEQLASDAAKAKAAGAQYGFTFGQVDRYYQLEPLPVSLRGSTGVSGKDNLTPDITSQAWVDAMTWYGKLFANRTSPKGVAVLQNDPDFLAGKTAYMVEGPWVVPTLLTAKINWGVALQPKFADGNAVTPAGSWSLAINPFSKEKAAAAIFVKWMAVDGGSGYIKYRDAPELAANVQGKKVYFAKSVFSSAEGKKAAAIIDYETSNTAVNRPTTIGYIEFEDIMNRMFADIRNGADAKKSLENASTELVKAWAKYKK